MVERVPASASGSRPVACGDYEGDDQAASGVRTDRSRGSRAKIQALIEAGKLFEVSSGDQTFQVTATCGGSTLHPGDDWDDLFARADRSLYAAKSAGRAALGWDETVIETIGR